MQIGAGIAAIVIAAIIGCGTGRLHQHAGARAIPGGTPADSFERSIKPMLARSCTPCHVPGGKMYDRLPFDNPDVVRSRLDSILRRLKAAKDRTLLEEWEKLPAAGHQDVGSCYQALVPGYLP
jgi:hypothetical protein